MKILATGFNRFGELSYNPTELMMPEIKRYALEWRDCSIVTEILPTEYLAAGHRLRTLLLELQPDAVVGFGVAPSSSEFLLERFALNLDDTAAPDNAGWRPEGIPIIATGPHAYTSTLPLAQIFDALKKAKIPVSYSNHAGTYVCNHVFYVARHEIDVVGRDTPCGFIHVPLVLGAPGAKPNYQSSVFNVLTGVRLCLETVRRHLFQSSLASRD